MSGANGIFSQRWRHSSTAAVLLTTSTLFPTAAVLLTTSTLFPTAAVLLTTSTLFPNNSSITHNVNTIPQQQQSSQITPTYDTFSQTYTNHYSGGLYVHIFRHRQHPHQPPHYLPHPSPNSSGHPPPPPRRPHPSHRHRPRSLPHLHHRKRFLHHRPRLLWRRTGLRPRPRNPQSNVPSPTHPIFPPSRTKIPHTLRRHRRQISIRHTCLQTLLRLLQRSGRLQLHQATSRSLTAHHLLLDDPSRKTHSRTRTLLLPS